MSASARLLAGNRRRRAAVEPLERRAMLTAAPTLVGSPIILASGSGTVAMAANGTFAVGASVGPSTSGTYTLSVQRYTAAGATTGSPFNADTSYDAIAGMVSDAAGDLAVLDTSNGEIFLAVTQPGKTSPTYVSVADNADGNNQVSSVAVNAAGQGVAVYRTPGGVETARPFTLSATATTPATLGTAFAVNEQDDVPFYGVAAAVAPDGTIGLLTNDGQNVYFRTFTAAGGTKSGLVTDAAFSPTQVAPTLTADAHGVFTGTWYALGVESDGFTEFDSLRAQQYASGGARVGSGFYVRDYDGGVLLASREGVLTLASGAPARVPDGVAAANFDLALNHESTDAVLDTASNSGLYGAATNGAGSAVVTYVDSNGTSIARRLSIPAADRHPYKGSPFTVGQTIQAEDYDSGGEGAAYHDLDATNRGGQYRLDSGVDVESISGGYDIGYGQAGEWTEYTVTIPTAGTYTAAFTVRGPVSGASAGAGGQFHANFNGVNKTGTLTITSTSTAFSTITATNLSLSAGTYAVRVMLDKNSSTNTSFAANFDSFKITATPTPTPTTTQFAGTTYGTAGSYNNNGNTIAKATDGNLSTFFDAPTASGAAVGIDLGSAKTVTQIKFAPRNGYGSRMVGGVFQASNTQGFTSGVVTVYTVGSAPANGSLTTVTPSTTTAYRYWRYVGPTNGYCDVAEFQLFGAGSGQLTGTTYGTPGSYQNNGNTIAKATDGNLSTYFDAPTGSGAAVGIDLGSAKTVKQIKFAPRNGYGSRMVGGVFQASNDANFGSGVVTVYTVGSAPASASLTTVNTNTTTAYRYWRYVGPANSNCNIAEFQLFA